MNCVRKLLKQCGWAWDKIGKDHFYADVTPVEECEQELSRVTITVRLEKGDKAGGWWVQTTDSSWGLHFPTLFAAMCAAETIRQEREADMTREEARVFAERQKAYVSAKVTFLRDDTGATDITEDKLMRLGWQLPDDMLAAADSMIQSALYKIGVTLSGAPILMAT